MISKSMNKIKYFFSLAIIFLASSINFIANNPQTFAAAPKCPTDKKCIELNDDNRYLYKNYCFDSDLGTFTPATACVHVYGANMKAEPVSIYESHLFPCDENIKAFCSGGDTCIWKRYECIEKTTPTCTLTASPDSITQGQTENITVSWTTTNAASATLNGVATLPNTAGSKVFPGVSTAATYTLAITGDVVVPPCIASVNIFTPPTGGLIPCGRLGNLPPAEGETDLIDESQPCSLCAMFYLLKKIINFITALSAGIGVFILIIAGLLYALSAGNPRNIELAKSAVTSVLIGLAIIFTAWLAIAVILQGMGYAGIGTWYQVSCPLPTPAPPI